MSAVEVLATLWERGASVAVRGDDLRIRAPRGAIDAQLRAALAAHKAELLRLLTRPYPEVGPATSTDAATDSPPEGALSGYYALLSETFERIASWWVEGADLPPAELEEDIDRAVLLGDVQRIRDALTVYEQAARENCARAHRWVASALVFLALAAPPAADARSCAGSRPPAPFAQGCYTGNGDDGRLIPTGIQQHRLVMVYKVDADADETDATYRTDTSGPGDASCLVSNGAPNTCGRTNRIQALNAGSFEIGTDDAVNTNGDPYCWFAWGLSEHFISLTWMGDGSSPRIIPLPADFTPAFAMVQLDDSAACFGSGNIYARSNDMPATFSYGWWNVGEAPRTNVITNLTTGGIEVQGCANETGRLYRAWAWEAAQGYGDAITWTGNGNGDNCASAGEAQEITAADPATNVITVGCQGNVGSCGAQGLACVAAGHTGVAPLIRGRNMGVNVIGPGHMANDFFSIFAPGGLMGSVLGSLDGPSFTVAGAGSFSSNLNDVGILPYAWVMFTEAAVIGTTSLQNWCNDTSTVACYANNIDAPGGIDFPFGANNDCSTGGLNGGTPLCGNTTCDCNLAEDGVVADPVNKVLGEQSAAFVEAEGDFMSCDAASCSNEFLLGQSGASFTLMCHVRSTLDADQTYMNKNGTTTSVYKMGRLAAGDDLLCSVKNTSGTAITDTANGLTITDYHFAACQFDNASDTVQAYLDGAFSGSPSAILTDAQGGSGDFSLGNDGTAGDLTGNTNVCTIVVGVTTAADLCRACSCGFPGRGCQCWIVDQAVYVDEGVNDTICNNCALPACDKGSPS